MGDKSKIEWTESTWNPATGCTLVSPGCKNCFAKRVAKRMQEMGKHKYRNGFDYTEHPDAIDQPLHWRKPRRIFVNSMSDLFHPDATMEFLYKVFYVMETAQQHTYQILTKRPERMAEFIRTWSGNFSKSVPENIWLGVSVESQQYVNRIAILTMIPAPVRFVSFEPLLGPVTADLGGIHWAIIGGESVTGHRPMKYEWANGLIDQCQEQNVPVFFKQWGGVVASAGGRTINGRTYDGYPRVVC